MSDGDKVEEERIVKSEREARGAEIILRRRRNRAIFATGLVGFVVLIFVLVIVMALS